MPVELSFSLGYINQRLGWKKRSKSVSVALHEVLLPLLQASLSILLHRHYVREIRRAF